MKNVDIKDFAKYIGISMISKNMSISPLKLQKILYYQQSWHMVRFGREHQLFDDIPQAWVNGPVYPVVFQEYKGKVKGMCDHLSLEHFVSDCDSTVEAFKWIVEKIQLEKEEFELSEQVNLLYGAKTQNQLILLTHSEKPWSDKREGLMPYDYSESELSLDTMYSYYKERYDNNHPR